MENIEKKNRENFRSCLAVLSSPGESRQINPLFNSPLLAMASVLLYAEVGYFYDGAEDFQMIDALCCARRTEAAIADYLFFDRPEAGYLDQAKIGSSENPELSATLIFFCPEKRQQTLVRLMGPGINGARELSLPADSSFLARLQQKNATFPLGVDLFFIDTNNRLTALPRTTQIEEIK